MKQLFVLAILLSLTIAQVSTAEDQPTKKRKAKPAPQTAHHPDTGTSYAAAPKNGKIILGRMKADLLHAVFSF